MRVYQLTFVVLDQTLVTLRTVLITQIVLVVVVDAYDAAAAIAAHTAQANAMITSAVPFDTIVSDGV